MDRPDPLQLMARARLRWLFTILSVIALACASCSSAPQQTSSSRGGTVQSPHITEATRMPLTDSAPPQLDVTPTVLVSPPQRVLLITTPTPLSIPASTTPISYEAEAPQNTLPSSTSVFGCSHCSGGKRVGDVGQSQTLRFNTIWEPQAGNYTLTIYYVNGFQHDNGTDMKVNGKDVAQFTEPSTGDWDTPASFSYTVSLNAGNNTILFYYPSTFGLDFDRIVV